jgi:serine/threonine protein phosphatase PrpC
MRWLRSCGVSWCCKIGKKPEAPNQDSYSILYVEDSFELYGIYDGHGPFGHDVSDLVTSCLPKLFLDHPDRVANPAKAFEESFVAMQRLTEAATKARMIDAQSSGTTCTMVYRTRADGRICVAHVGDSRSVVASKKAGKWETTELTIDHKPNLPEEKRRIESADPPGRVVFDGYYNHRVFAQKEMIPGLNMSRAMGDIVAHQRAGLTAQPDTRTLSSADYVRGESLCALCSDGVWEFIESEDFMTFMGRAEMSLQDRSEGFARESFNRWMKDSEDEISDDITIIAFTP